MMSGPGGYPSSQNQQMYAQSMPRTISGGQLNTMMTHSGMMMTSSQPHMINPQGGGMVTQQGYPQGMMSSGQAPPQMMAVISSQSHMIPMGQPMMTTTSHMGNTQGIPQSQHMNIITSQHQQIGASTQQMQMSAQQSFIQHQQQSMNSSQAMFTVGGGQPRSPAIVGGQLSQALTPGGPPSTGGPPSNNPQTPMNPASQQAVPTPATPQQAPSSVQSCAAQDGPSGGSSMIPPDPTSIAKNLMMKDLRHAILEVNRAAADVVRPGTSRQQLDASVTSHNPMSVNPQSVNPLSVNPSSVKSLDEPKSVDSADRKTALTPKERYTCAMNNFMAVCDQIEINLMLILEAQKQCTRFDKMFTGELKAVGDMANANYSQYALGYLESTNRVRGAIDRTLRSLSAQIEKVRAAQAHANSRAILDEEKMETNEGDSESMNQAHSTMYQ